MKDTTKSEIVHTSFQVVFIYQALMERAIQRQLSFMNGTKGGCQKRLPDCLVNTTQQVDEISKLHPHFPQPGQWTKKCFLFFLSWGRPLSRVPAILVSTVPPVLSTSPRPRPSGAGEAKLTNGHDYQDEKMKSVECCRKEVFVLSKAMNEGKKNRLLAERKWELACA